MQSVDTVTNLEVPGRVTFPDKMKFELMSRKHHQECDVWGGNRSNKVVRGSDSHPWCQMDFQNEHFRKPPMFTMDSKAASTLQYSMCSMSGEPLLLLQESEHFSLFRGATLKCHILRIDPQTDEAVRLCTIRSVSATQLGSMSLKHPYEIVVYPAAGFSGQLHCSGENLGPGGSILNILDKAQRAREAGAYNPAFGSKYSLLQFSFGFNGEEVAKTIRSSKSTYSLEVSPNWDVLLFIAIAGTITSMENKAVSEQRSNSR